jgi:hypothetical protein
MQLKSGKTMGDPAEQEPLEQINKRLLNEFIEARHDDETPESIGQAYLEYILKRERIRRDATERRCCMDHSLIRICPYP